MISVVLRDWRWRLALLLLVLWLMYLLEPAFHQHEAELDPEQARGLSAIGISATLSYFAGLSMILLLGGFISSDRREGYTRIFFSYPTSPLALYALRWLLALLLALAGATIFLVGGQLVAWGEFRGGWSGLLLALLSALVYGGLVAFLSAALSRGDAWVALFLFLPTFVPQVFDLGLSRLPVGLRQLLLFVLPPHSALQMVWQQLLDGTVAWSGALYAAGYGVVWLILGALVLRLREWP